jgi:predicted dehydrogenase
MDKVRVGVIGAGWWATTNHIPELKKRGDVELVSVCRLGQDLLQKIKDEFGFAHATEDYHELVNLGLDAVIVSSPHYLHYDHAKAALEKGLHVMIEKPMTLDKDQAWELVRIAKEKNLHLIIPYGWNYKKFTQEAKRLLDSGLIGETEYVLCHMASPLRDFLGGTGGTSEMPDEWKPSLSAPEPSTWQVKENGGGYAHGQITHSSGLMFWLTGLRAAEVSCRMTAPNSKVDLYDSATVVFENGALGTISGSATVAAGQSYQVDIRVFGTKGTLMLDVEGKRERMSVNEYNGNAHTIEITPGEGDYDCFVPPHRLIELVRGLSVVNQSPGDVGARSVEMLTAMFRSSNQGGVPVKV